MSSTNIGAGTALWWFFSALGLLISAVLVAIFGDIEVAIFLGIIWVGWSNNINAATSTRALLRGRGL